MHARMLRHGVDSPKRRVVIQGGSDEREGLAGFIDGVFEGFVYALSVQAAFQVRSSRSIRSPAQQL